MKLLFYIIFIPGVFAAMLIESFGEMFVWVSHKIYDFMDWIEPRFIKP